MIPVSHRSFDETHVCVCNPLLWPRRHVDRVKRHEYDAQVLLEPISFSFAIGIRKQDTGCVRPAATGGRAFTVDGRLLINVYSQNGHTLQRTASGRGNLSGALTDRIAAASSPTERQTLAPTGTDRRSQSLGGLGRSLSQSRNLGGLSRAGKASRRRSHRRQLDDRTRGRRFVNTKDTERRSAEF
jgi:hypothetical protein